MIMNLTCKKMLTINDNPIRSAALISAKLDVVRQVWNMVGIVNNQIAHALNYNELVDSV